MAPSHRWSDCHPKISRARRAPACPSHSVSTSDRGLQPQVIFAEMQAEGGATGLSLCAQAGGGDRTNWPQALESSARNCLLLNVTGQRKLKVTLHVLRGGSGKFRAGDASPPVGSTPESWRCWRLKGRTLHRGSLMFDHGRQTLPWLETEIVGVPSSRSRERNGGHSRSQLPTWTFFPAGSPPEVPCSQLFTSPSPPPDALHKA